MITKEFLTDMLTSFCKIHNKKLDNDLIDAYFKALKRFTNDEIKKAGYRCLEECQYFPKPYEIITRINHNRNYDQSVQVGKCTCSKCGESNKFGIKCEDTHGLWECRECFTGMTVEQIKERYEGIIRFLEDKFGKSKYKKRDFEYKPKDVSTIRESMEV